MDTSLIARLGLNTTTFDRGIDKARGKINDFGKGLLSLGGLGGTAAFAKLGADALKMADDLGTTAQTVRGTTDELQVLRYNAQQAGVGVAQLDASLIKANTAVQEAANGNQTYAAQLRTLGLDAEKLVKLPLAERYTAIAEAVAGAKDQSQAYLATAKLFGEDAGPKVMAALNRLAKEGYPEVARQAEAAGAIMSERVIAGLDEADKAIASWKTRITIAIGNILVNFKTEEGLKLLGLQLLRVAASFGGGVLDAIVQALDIGRAVMTGTFRGVTNILQDGLVEAFKVAAVGINSVIPDFLKNRGFSIDIKGLDEFKSTGLGVADEITNAIAQTSPTTFKDDFTGFWDEAIADQKKVIDEQTAAQTSAAKDLTKGAETIKTAGAAAGKDVGDAGTKVEGNIVAGANDFRKAGDQVETNMKRGAGEVKTVMGRMSFGVVGRQDEELSDRELEEKIRNLSSDLASREFRDFAGGPNSYDPLLGFTRSQLNQAREELATRRQFASRVGNFGSDRAQSFYSVSDFDRLIELVKPSPTAEKTLSAIESIDENLRVITRPIRRG